LLILSVKVVHTGNNLISLLVAKRLSSPYPPKQSDEQPPRYLISITVLRPLSAPFLEGDKRTLSLRVGDYVPTHTTMRFSEILTNTVPHEAKVPVQQVLDSIAQVVRWLSAQLVSALKRRCDFFEVAARVTLVLVGRRDPSSTRVKINPVGRHVPPPSAHSARQSINASSAFARALSSLACPSLL
jgi:hypothetical protein